MIHNGIEYGIMAAYAEELSILRHANVRASWLLDRTAHALHEAAA